MDKVVLTTGLQIEAKPRIEIVEKLDGKQFVIIYLGPLMIYTRRGVDEALEDLGELREAVAEAIGGLTALRGA